MMMLDSGLLFGSPYIYVNQPCSHWIYFE